MCRFITAHSSLKKLRRLSAQGFENQYLIKTRLKGSIFNRISETILRKQTLQPFLNIVQSTYVHGKLHVYTMYQISDFWLFLIFYTMYQISDFCLFLILYTIYQISDFLLFLILYTMYQISDFWFFFLILYACTKYQISGCS